MKQCPQYTYSILLHMDLFFICMQGKKKLLLLFMKWVGTFKLLHFNA